jgi:hypothetical protein
MRWLVLSIVALGCRSAPPPEPAHPAPIASAPAPAPVPAASFDGSWVGVLGGRLHLALAIRGDGGVLDSIDQGAKLPIDHLTASGAQLHFEIAAVDGHYDGTLAGDTITGTWRQGTLQQPLAFTRSTPPAASSEPAARPQLLDAPIDVTVPEPPTVLKADGRSHLVYELDVANFSPVRVALVRLDVKAGVRSLVTFDRTSLGGMTRIAGEIPHDDDARTVLPPGGHAVVFVWVSFDGAAPSKIDHELAVKAGDREFTVPAPVLAIAATQPRLIAPPLTGKNWVAGNGPSNASPHRRALIPLGGHARIAQRFAIDWVQIGDDDTTFTGDESQNASYHAYGEHALAVAAGIVVEVKDGIAENVPHKPLAAPTLDNVAGNHVVIDLGNGAFAMWAHLQPGSLKVKVGDKVKPGQLLGLVGNSGNSTEPHLHFQVTDAASPLGAEGIPYAFPRFSARKQGEPLRDHVKEMPTEDEIVSF